MKRYIIIIGGIVSVYLYFTFLHFSSFNYVHLPLLFTFLVYAYWGIKYGLISAVVTGITVDLHKYHFGETVFLYVLTLLAVIFLHRVLISGSNFGSNVVLYWLGMMIYYSLTILLLFIFIGFEVVDNKVAYLLAYSVISLVLSLMLAIGIRIKRGEVHEG